MEKIILSGFGGQGVLSAGIMLGEAAVLTGKNATFFPSYGAEMRGGTANCNVILSDGPIASPVISKANTLIALNQPSLNKFKGNVIPGGLMLLNASMIQSEEGLEGFRIIRIPVEDLAFKELGNPKVANSIIIGAYIRATGVLKLEDVKKAIQEKFGKKGQKVVDLNFKAIDLGYAAAAECEKAANQKECSIK